MACITCFLEGVVGESFCSDLSVSGKFFKVLNKFTRVDRPLLSSAVVLSAHLGTKTSF